MDEKIYTLLGISKADATEEMRSQITTILEIVKERLIGKLLMLTGIEHEVVPSELQGVVVEICVNRYNRIGSEGAASHNVGGETISWAAEDYFAPYEQDIKDYVNAMNARLSGGRLRFL